MFGRFGRHISHRDQLSPQRAPEHPGDGGQGHSYDPLVLFGRTGAGQDKTSVPSVIELLFLSLFSLRATMHCLCARTRVCEGWGVGERDDVVSGYDHPSTPVQCRILIGYVASSPDN